MLSAAAAVGTLHLAVLGCLFVTACSIEVFTNKELEAVNGTDTRLKCTFSSSAPVGDNIIIVWLFRPLSGGEDQTIFYYHKNAYPQLDGRFQGRAVWDGNIMRNDASILIRNIQPMDNGTYLCQVKNPPDVHVEMGEIQVRVVNKAKLSEIFVLALVIGVGSAAIILIVLAFVLYRYCRMKKIHRSTPVSMLECTEKLNEKPCNMKEVYA
uniref:Myelin protein P0 n=1 Tax=Xenopus laevis TaxID=8355 RepID=Q6DDH9_XENLA|nr:Eva1-prov protein [Xenopus laevis]